MYTSLVKNTYSLSIRISSDGFSLFIHNENNILISSTYKETSGINFLEDLRFWLIRQNEVQEGFRIIRVFIESDYYSLIPDVFFDEEYKRSLLLMHHPSLPQSYEITNFALKNQHAIILFAFNSQILHVLNEKIHAFEILPHFYPTIKKTKTTRCDQITLWIREAKMDACVFKNNQIQLLNTFTFNTEEDLVYHTLNIYDQLNMQLKNTSLEVYTLESTQPVTLLQNYISALTIKPIQSAYENYQWEI